MRVLEFELWSQGTSWLHRRDPRSKILVALVFLISIATQRAVVPHRVAGFAALLVLAALAARLPKIPIFLRACAVLPFAGTFALLSWISGDTGRAGALLANSFLSASVAVLIAAMTTLPALFRGLQQLGAPVLLVEVVQVLVRYLTVLTTQASRMAQAAAARGGFRRAQAAGAVGTLFASSYARADRIHNAMLARGYGGSFPVLRPLRWSSADTLFSAGASAAVLAIRLI